MPTFTVTPAGAAVKTRSLLVTVEKLTGLLKVTVMALGVTVTVSPLKGLVDRTRSTSMALMALMALMRPKPPVWSQVAGAAPFMGVVAADWIRACLI